METKFHKRNPYEDYTHKVAFEDGFEVGCAEALDGCANYIQGYALAEKEKGNSEGESFWLKIARRIRSLSLS